jgi:glutamate racemase
VVGVLATSHTVASASVARLCSRYGAQAKIELMACPGLVECVERGDLATDATRALLIRYMAPLLDAGSDVLVVGCTHYSFLIDLIRAIAGPKVLVLDPADAVARELSRRLGAQRRAPRTSDPASEWFASSGPMEMAQTVMSTLWGKNITVHNFETPSPQALR